ncbi:hypothetical protein J3F84DRAFT_384287 [Trichoderma pleuroticola]
MPLSISSQSHPIPFLILPFFPFSIYGVYYYYTCTNPPHKKAWTHLDQNHQAGIIHFVPASSPASLSNSPVLNVHHSPPKKKERKKKTPPAYKSQRLYGRHTASSDWSLHPHTTFNRVCKIPRQERPQLTRFSTVKNTCTSHRPFSLFCLPQKPAHLSCCMSHLRTLQLSPPRQKNAARENPPAAPAQHRPRFRVVPVLSSPWTA